MAPAIADLPAVQSALLAWHAEHGMQAAWRESGDPYHVLVASVMAQQTQMIRVLPAYERFLTAFPTVESLAEASPADAIRAWAGMGYNQRALRLHRAARTVAATGWPRGAAELRRIEGIGPFTAAIVASFAFGQQAACVDTNVRRVLGRLAACEDASAAEMQRLADTSMAPERPAAWNQALMDYGARVCTPRPKCRDCVVARYCPSERTGERIPPMAAEGRASYRASLRSRREVPYEGSRRFYRGRTLDVLRELAPGERIDVVALLGRLGAALPGATETGLREIVVGLVRDGLAALHAGEGGAELVSLPAD